MVRTAAGNMLCPHGMLPAADEDQSPSLANNFYVSLSGMHALRLISQTGKCNPAVGPDQFRRNLKHSCLPLVSVSLTVCWRCFYVFALHKCTFTLLYFDGVLYNL